jgi:hypothetical protein
LKAKSRVPQGESLGEATFVVKDAKATFVFESSVPQYAFLESSGGSSPSSPWQSLPAGAAAFNAFSKGVKLPPLSLARTSVKV